MLTRADEGAATAGAGAALWAALIANSIAGIPVAAAAADGAETYPNKPVRMIVAQGIGTSVDTLGRIISAQLSEQWGKQVIVDNRGGAGGTIGGEIAARAVPDGYTLLMSSTAMQLISPPCSSPIWPGSTCITSRTRAAPRS